MTGDFTLSTGDVIRYDYLWREEHDAGRRDGAKDRPCTVVLTSAAAVEGGRRGHLAYATQARGRRYRDTAQTGAASSFG